MDTRAGTTGAEIKEQGHAWGSHIEPSAWHWEAASAKGRADQAGVLGLLQIPLAPDPHSLWPPSISHSSGWEGLAWTQAQKFIVLLTLQGGLGALGGSGIHVFCRQLQHFRAVHQVPQAAPGQAQTFHSAPPPLSAADFLGQQLGSRSGSCVCVCVWGWGWFCLEAVENPQPDRK